MIRGIAKNPNIIVVWLNRSNITRPASNNVAKNMVAFLGDIKPLANGRFFVRSTILSKSRSHRSLTTQPAPRIMTAPITNNKI